MKLEVGMYVITRNGMIAKIIDKRDVSGSLHREEIVFILDNGNKLALHSQKVVKASHNIIDLIEVGDVIIDKEGHKHPINYEFETDYNDEYKSYEISIDDHITLFFKDGLSIVTKEAFKSIEYKVGDE